MDKFKSKTKRCYYGNYLNKETITITYQTMCTCTSKFFRTQFVLFEQTWTNNNRLVQTVAIVVHRIFLIAKPVHQSFFVVIRISWYILIKKNL